MLQEFISVSSWYTGTAEKKLQKLMFKKYTLHHTLVHTHVCGAYINRNKNFQKQYQLLQSSSHWYFSFYS